MRKLFIGFALLTLTSIAGTASAENGLTIKGVRYFSYPAFTRVVLEVEASAPYVLTKGDDGRRLIFTAYEGPLSVKAKLPSINDGVVKDIEQKEDAGKFFLFINLDKAGGEVKDFVLRSPDRIVLDIARGTAPPQPSVQRDPSSPVIVIDPGHGGRDTGIVTPQGPEKTQTLDLAFALRKQIKKKNPHVSVVLTREKDLSLSLDERAAISNAAGAALFLSLHGAQGNDIKVYILEIDSEPAPKAAVEHKDFLGFEALSEQQEILWGRQQAAHTKESGSLGRKLMRQITSGDGAEPIQAPLAALKPVNAAAVVIEVGAELDRAKAAETIVKGIEQYVRENR